MGKKEKMFANQRYITRSIQKRIAVLTQVMGNSREASQRKKESRLLTSISTKKGRQVSIYSS